MSALAEAALANLATDYPYAPAHVVSGPSDLGSPAELHPAFHSCFDWHSCVHMHWLLVRLLGDEADPARIVAALGRTLGPAAIAVEAAYLRDHPLFERPYGWAWAALLAAECMRSPHPAARSWAAALLPLSDAVADLMLDWLPRATYPVRGGEHTNSAFALGLLLDSFAVLRRDDVVAVVLGKARAWFGTDRDYPAGWEPSGFDFLSPALAEADLMRRVLPPGEFSDWLTGFLPSGPPGNLLTPPVVGDLADGKHAHLAGLSLSRAWHLREIAAALASGDGRRPVLDAAADRHERAVASYVTGRDFASEHWLATFAHAAARAGRR